MKHVHTFTLKRLSIELLPIESFPMKYLSDNICVVITNYDFSSNADILKLEFSKYFHSIIIDSSSPIPPENLDISIPNNYYPGLWNAAYLYAASNKYEWLMFIASDILIEDVKQLSFFAHQATLIDSIGIYSASLTSNSRTSFSNLYGKSSLSMREVGIVEGFFFLARLEILNQLHPIDERNHSGWGVDVMTCYSAYQAKKIVVTDDRVRIFHPRNLPEHAIDINIATQESLQYLGSKVFEWAKEVQISCATHTTLIPTESTLDLGCGTQIANPFNVKYLYGIDIRENVNPNIKVADLNVEPIPFPDNYFDSVTAYDFIEHVPRLIYCPQRRFPFIELMNEIFRVLRPGGFFVSNTPAYPDEKAFQDPTHVNIITEKTFENYFCHQHLWARMYGFNGQFILVSQVWDDGKLQSIMRTIK